MIEYFTKGKVNIVAGRPGMGKTTLLHNAIISLLYTCTSEELRLMLIGGDSFGGYEPMRQSYLWLPVATDFSQAMTSLETLNAEIERRYNLLRQAGVVKFEDYNATSSVRLPYLVTVIDEYSDLINNFGEEFESLIAHIAQIGHPVGIHIIMSTNQITENVITPRIRANFPSRIALKVNTSAESMLILDEPGAEDLKHKGKVLFPYNSITYELQNPLVTEKEISAVVSNLIKKGSKKINA